MKQQRKVILIPILAAVLASALAAGEAETSGYLADFSSDFGRASEKLVDLAGAIPAEKYGWRPSDEVRTVSETLVHVADANFYLARSLGLAPPQDLPEDLEKEVTAKDAVIELLKRSQEQIRRAVETSEVDLDREIDFFGRRWTVRRLFMQVAAHTHEHLGQSIAYARSIGVVPPWSRPRPQDTE